MNTIQSSRYPSGDNNHFRSQSNPSPITTANLIGKLSEPRYTSIPSDRNYSGTTPDIITASLNGDGQNYSSHQVEQRMGGGIHSQQEQLS